MIDPRQPDFENTPASDRRPDFGYAPADPHPAPLVTVLTASYNSSELLRETARSLFRSTLQQWEWLIVDDASTRPQSQAMLAEYAARDPRVRVVRHERNGGLSAAMNTGFAQARAELVFLLDDDDLLEPTALEKLWWTLRSYPQFAAANGWEVGFGARQYLWREGFEHGPKFLDTNYATSRAMIRRAAHVAVGGFDEDNRGGGMDWEFWLRLARAGLWGRTVPEFLDWYRTRAQHSDRWTNLDGGDGQRHFIARLHEQFGALRERWPEYHVPADKPLEPLGEPPQGANRLRRTRPRLLMIVPWLTVGGADKFNLDLVSRLVREGWEVSIATTVEGECDWAPAFAAHTPEIFILHRFLRRADYPAFLRYLIDSRQPDVVMVSNSELGYALLPYLRRHCPGPAYVDYCHSESIVWKDGGYPRYGAVYQEQIELNLVASEHLKRWMAARGAEPERIEVVHINVDADWWSPCYATRARIRQAEGVSETMPLIVFAGRLHLDKQPAVLMAALERLAKRGHAFAAWIIGDGPDRPAVEQRIRRAGLDDRVRLLGTLSPELVRERFRAADIFFLPSLWEGIALTLYEAMACGLAVVAADVGGQSELVTPDCGILVPRSTPEAEAERYAQVLADLIEDSGRRARLGAACRARIEREFTLNAMVQRTIGCFERARDLARRYPRALWPAAWAEEAAVQAVERARLADELERHWHGARAGTVASELDELRAWVAELTQAKDWLSTQLGQWERTARDKEAQIAQLKCWIDELERGKAWLDEAWKAAQSENQQLRASLERLERKPLVRILRRSGLM
ncbi:MAG: glycosyltransferase [Phycisphaerales bacterium]|nr:glycosyltransferase [Phycisphaerales bacterium]